MWYTSHTVPNDLRHGSSRGGRRELKAIPSLPQPFIRRMRGGSARAWWPCYDVRRGDGQMCTVPLVLKCASKLNCRVQVLYGLKRALYISRDSGSRVTSAHKMRLPAHLSGLVLYGRMWAPYSTTTAAIRVTSVLKLEALVAYARCQPSVPPDHVESPG